MNVETYEINETTSAGETDPLDAEAVALIERMGLKGQKRLVGGGERGAVSVLPYQEMTAEERAVYEALFPAKDVIEDYAAGPIPMRVLQAAALAKEREWFDRLQVWHKQSGSAKDDPLLVGVLAHETHPTLDRQYFLIARWGDALKPYRELVAEAAIGARSHLKGCLAKCRSELEAAVAMVESSSDAGAIRWAGRAPQMFNEQPPRA